MNSTLPLVINGGLVPGGLATGQTVTVATGRPEGAALTRAASAATFNEAPPLFLAGPLRRAAVLVGDLMGTLAVVLCVPFVILAVGTPIALCVRLLLWVGGLL